MVADAKKEEFRQYLEKEGVLDTLLRSLKVLYETQEKPSNPVRFLRNHLAGQNIEELREVIEKLTKDNQELQAQVQDLTKENAELKDKIDAQMQVERAWAQSAAAEETRTKDLPSEAVEDVLMQAEDALSRAVKLDPALIEGWSVRATLFWRVCPHIFQHTVEKYACFALCLA